jgi:hypothetical protein
LPETEPEFRTQALQRCAILCRLREAARMRCCAAAKRTQISFRARVARALTTACGPCNKQCATAPDGSYSPIQLGLSFLHAKMHSCRPTGHHHPNTKLPIQARLIAISANKPMMAPISCVMIGLSLIGCFIARPKRALPVRCWERVRSPAVAALPIKKRTRLDFVSW